MSRLNPPLDFICVGAPKSGTTTLILRRHPDVALPVGKEAPAFLRYRDDDQISHHEWRTFIEGHYPSNWQGRKLGKIDPSYWYSPHIPSFLAKNFPDVKIIIILRNPIDRLVSDFKMRVRFGTFSPDMDQFIKDNFQEEKLEIARNEFNPERIGLGPYMIVAGEYKRILESYFSFFHAEQVMIISLQQLNSERTISKIYSFLGIETVYVPKISIRNSSNIPRIKAILANVTLTFLSAQSLQTPRKVIGKVVSSKAKRRLSMFLKEHMDRSKGKVRIDPEHLVFFAEYYSSANNGLEDFLTERGYVNLQLCQSPDQFHRS